MPVLGTGTFVVTDAILTNISGGTTTVPPGISLPAGFGFPQATYVVEVQGNNVSGSFVISLVGGHSHLVLTGYLGGTYFVDNAPSGFSPTTGLTASTTSSVNLFNAGDTVTVQFGSWSRTLNGIASSWPGAIAIPDGTPWATILTALKTVTASLIGNGGSGSTSGNCQNGDNVVTGNYQIIGVWWVLPDKDSCGNGQTSHMVMNGSTTTPPGTGYRLLDPNNPIPAQPTVIVEDIEPNHGTIAGGTSVTIRGSGFGDGATVKFGVTAATGVVVNSQYSITCVAPAHAAGPVNVVVTNVDGTHN